MPPEGAAMASAQREPNHEPAEPVRGVAVPDRVLLGEGSTREWAERDNTQVRTPRPYGQRGILGGAQVRIEPRALNLGQLREVVLRLTSGWVRRGCPCGPASGFDATLPPGQVGWSEGVVDCPVEDA